MTTPLTLTQLQEQMARARSAMAELAQARRSVETWLTKDHERRQALIPDGQAHLDAGTACAHAYTARISQAVSCCQAVAIVCRQAYRHVIEAETIANLALNLQPTISNNITGLRSTLSGQFIWQQNELASLVASLLGRQGIAIPPAVATSLAGQALWQRADVQIAFACADALAQPQIVNELTFLCALMHPQVSSEAASLSDFFAPDELRRLVFDPQRRRQSATMFRQEEQALAEQLPAFQQELENMSAILAALHQRSLYLSGDLPAGWLADNDCEPPGAVRDDGTDIEHAEDVARAARRDSGAESPQARVWMPGRDPASISVRWIADGHDSKMEVAEIYDEGGHCLARLLLDKTMAH